MVNIFAEISLLEEVLLGSLGVLFIAQMYFYIRYMAAPMRKLQR